MTSYNSENKKHITHINHTKQWTETQIFPAKCLNTAVLSNINILTQITVVQECGITQDRQCTYNVTQRRVRVTIVAMAKQ